MRLHSLLLLAVYRLAAALDSNGIFSHPPKAGPALSYRDNIALTLGEVEELKWDTGMREYTLQLWQQSRAGGARRDGTEIFKKEKDDREPGGISWEVQTYDFDLDDSPVFFLGIGFNGSGDSGFTSHYFNITRDEPASTPSGSAETSRPTATDDADGDAASSAPDPGKFGPNLGLSLGLGLGLGIPLAALIGGLISYVLLKKRGKKRAMQAELEKANFAQRQAEWYAPGNWSQPKPPMIHEAMDTPQSIAELPGKV